MRGAGSQPSARFDMRAPVKPSFWLRRRSAVVITSRKVNFILDADVRDLRQVVTGHFAYYAVPSNARALSAFRHYVTDLWRRTA